MRVRCRLGWTIGCVWMAACGSNAPTTPGSPLFPSQLELAVGPQVVTFTGFAASTDPDFPPCTSLIAPRSGTSVTTRVLVTREGDEWVARVTPPESGDLELRFRHTATTSTGYVVRGTARGCAADQTYGPHEALDVNLCVRGNREGPTATLEGVAPPLAVNVQGRISGVSSFSDSTGAASHCTAISMFLRRN
jgi:hypothetical protein